MMNMKTLMIAAIASIGLVMPAAAATKLAFALDESGSVSSSEFNLMQDGLANALGQIPTDGTYEITVVTFSSSARIQYSLENVLIDSAATLASVQNSVRNLTNWGGGTNIQSALNLIANTTVSDSDTGLINVVTDGVSSGFTNASVRAAGWDGLSFEAVTSDAITTSLLPAAYAGSNIGGILVPSGGTVPDPRTKGFVFEVATFEDFDAAIGSKVSAIVNPAPVPLPAGAVLILTAVAGLGGVRATKRRNAA